MLRIKKDVWNAIIVQARCEAPLEACGYLADKEGVVARHFPLTNVDASAEHYSLQPEEQFAAVRQMRAAGLKLRAVYHSHPASPARPSEEDIKLAHDQSISYVIVSLLEGREAVRSFWICGSVVTPEEIEIL